MSEGMVNVWQFYIFGKKPVGLKEARDSLVNVFFKKGYKPIYPNAGKFIPSKPQIINGRQYSGKVIDIISEQNISVEHIERCIEKGRQWQDGEYISYLCPSDLSHKPCTISLDKDGRVVRIN